MERWESVTLPHFKEAYSVSDAGRVRGDVDCKGWKAGRILRTFLAGCGYPYVKLRHDGKVKSIAVHVLVAAAFCERTHGAQEVNHRNGIKTDNRATNLEWVTKSCHTNGITQRPTAQ